MGTLNIFGQWLVGNLWQLSIELCILAGIVGMILFLFRIKSPSLKHLFWGLVLAKPVITFLIASPISLYWFLKPPKESIAPPPATTVNVREVAATEFKFSPGRPGYNRLITSRTIPVKGYRKPSFWKQINGYGIAALIWITFAAVLTLRFIIGFIYVVVIFQRSKEPEHDFLELMVRDIAGKLNIKRAVKVAVSDVNHGPVLAGVLYPTILIPSDLIDHLSNQQFRYVIAHELIHVKRFDNLVLIIQRLAEIFLFFHPIVWLCGWIMRQQAEAACDDAVIQELGSSTEYADSLTRVAEVKGNLTRRLLVNTFAATESNFGNRIRRILKGGTGRLTLGFTAFCIVTLITIACLGLPSRSNEDKKEKHKIPKKEEGEMKKKSTATMTEKKLDWVPKGKPKWHKDWINPYIRGIQQIANHLNSGTKITPVDYETVMGDSGVAFMMPADGQSVKRYDGQNNPGWWPLEPLGLLRMKFLEKTIGREIEVKWTPDGWKKVGNQWKNYKDYYEPAIRSSLDNDKPCLAGYHTWWAITTGYKSDTSQLYGMCTNTKPGEEKISKIDIDPNDDLWKVIVFGKKINKLDRKKADYEALKFAIKLHHDQIFLNDPDQKYPLNDPQGLSQWYTGKKAYQTWIEWLSDPKRYSEQGHTHANTKWHIVRNRKMAVRYLKSLQKRHSKEFNKCLDDAIKNYEKVIQEAIKIDTSQASITSVDGRQKMIEQIKKIETLEAKAVAKLAKALETEKEKPPVIHSTASLDKKKNWIKGVKPLNYGKGNANSLMASFTSVLNSAGSNISYNDLMGNSGAAFSFCVTKDGKPCGLGWDSGCGYNHFSHVWKACGYTPVWIKVKSKETADLSAFRRQICNEIDKGNPLISFNPMGDYLYSIIVGYDNNGAILLCQPASGGWTEELKQAKKDSTGYYRTKLLPFWAIPITKKGDLLPKKELALNALKNAVIQAETSHFKFLDFGGYASGFNAYKKFIAFLENVDSLKGLEEKKQQNFVTENIAVHGWLLNAREAAASYLNDIAKEYDSKTTKQIQKAAKYYQEITDKLKTINGKQPKSLNEWNSDAGINMRLKQAEVMRECLKLEENAIAELANAISTIEGKPYKPTIKPTEGHDKVNAKSKVHKKIISKVPPMVWDKTGDCTIASALSTALKATDHPYSYSDIMGYSALAFRTRWRGDKNKKNTPWWCGSIPVGEFPEELNTISKMTGWKFISTGMLEDQPEKIKEYFPKVIKSINDNLPLVGYPTGKNLNCGVLYGYEENADKLQFIWRDPFKGDKETAIPAADCGPWLMFLDNWEKPESAKKRLLASLIRGVSHWTRKQTGDPKYYTYSYGKEALAIWIDDLNNVSTFSEAQKKELFFCNWWNFITLVDARKNASRFLNDNSKLLSGKSKKHLKNVAELYQKEFDKLRKPFLKKKAFFGPASGKKIEDWTPEVRKLEIKVLTKALEIEKNAIKELKKVLKAEDVFPIVKDNKKKFYGGEL